MKKRVLGLLLALIVATLAAGCSTSGSDTPQNEDEIVVRVGLVGEMTEMWAPVQENLESENIRIEIVKFADYTIPNQALADGEIDLNAFQHHAFLNNEVESKGLDLVPIGNTLLSALNVYSVNVDSLEGIQAGDKIAIPNDLTNGGRALKVLETAGLIQVDPAVGYSPELRDITSNPLNLEFIEVEASNLPSLLPDVAAAVINGNHAHDYGLVPAEDAIFAESVEFLEEDNPYINIIVARTEDKDNEIYLKVVEAYNRENVAKVINEAFGGLYVPAWFE